MATFTLDDIRDAAEKKYGSTDIDLGDGRVLSLPNPLRLPKDKRDALSAIQDKADEDGADQGETMRSAIRIVAADAVLCEEFLRLVGDDLALLATVFSTYTSGSQVGEASASQD